jgi:hypothetical protein
MSLDELRAHCRPENRIASALVGLLGATQALTTLASSKDTLALLASEERDTGEIALARNQLDRVLHRIEAKLEHAG